MEMDLMEFRHCRWANIWCRLQVNRGLFTLIFLRFSRLLLTTLAVSVSINKIQMQLSRQWWLIHTVARWATPPLARKLFLTMRNNSTNNKWLRQRQNRWNKSNICKMDWNPKLFYKWSTCSTHLVSHRHRKGIVYNHLHHKWRRQGAQKQDRAPKYAGLRK